MTGIFNELTVDHVRFYVRDLADAAEHLASGYGFTCYAETPGAPCGVRSCAVGTGDIRLVLTSASNSNHPGSAYVDQHGDGVADIALGTSAAAAAFAEAVRRGARPVMPPTERSGIVTASIMGFGDVTHTFIQRPASMPVKMLPGLDLLPERAPFAAAGLTSVDHFAVCVEPGQLRPTVDFYVTVLDFDIMFAERITVGAQAMDSMVVQSKSREVILTVIEPDLSGEPGQIDQFLKGHGGAGVQHIAFMTENIVETIGLMKRRGIEFLSTPDTYYDMVTERLVLSRYSVAQLRDFDILVDQDQDGQLLQIFAKSVHPRGTLFYEVIERLGARSFGSGNIKALYAAIQRHIEQHDL